MRFLSFHKGDYQLIPLSETWKSTPEENTNLQELLTAFTIVKHAIHSSLEILQPKVLFLLILEENERED